MFLKRGIGDARISFLNKSLYDADPARVCFRTNESPRLSSEPRSVDGCAICTGSPADSRPSQTFSSCAFATIRRPSWATGIPDFAQRCTTEIGWPRNAAMAGQPFNTSDSAFATGFLTLAMSNLR